MLEGGFICIATTGETTALGSPHPSMSDGFEASQCLAFPFPSFPFGFWVLCPLHPLLARAQLSAAMGRTVPALHLTFHVC